MTQITNPRSRKQSFKYDVHGRLSSVLDHDENVLESFVYHYRTEPPTNLPGITNTENWVLSKKYLEPNPYGTIEMIEDGANAPPPKKNISKQSCPKRF